MNVAGRFQGRIDSPLTPRGVEQAECVAKLLAAHVRARPARILSSPLRRTMRTAEIVGQTLGLPVVPDPRLIEVGMGLWEGLTGDEIDASWLGARGAVVRNGWAFVAPEGERLGAVEGRLGALLGDLAADPGVTHILVCHAIAGRVLRGLWAGLPSARAFRLEIPQDAVFRLHGEGAIDRVPPADPDFAGTR